MKNVTLKFDERKSEELNPVNLVKPFDAPKTERVRDHIQDADPLYRGQRARVKEHLC